METDMEKMYQQQQRAQIQLNNNMSSGQLSNMSNGQFTFSLETPSLSSGTLDKYLKSVLGSDSSTAIPDLLKPPNAEDRGNVPPVEIMFSSGKPPEREMELKPPVHTQRPPQQQPQPLPMMSTDPEVNNQQLTTTDQNGGEMIPLPRAGQSYVDITEYLNMPQSEAAKKLGIPPSTLSKRWKEAVRKRKWPYRMICKIDKEIMTLLHNVPQGPNAPPLPEEIEAALGTLLRRRQDELRPVVIRI
ncbi:hypothetical protein PROFUN_02311 [Planoprotostelium fungivorum]|uniref:RWP-RK domain-containing protein n=1 Tax=Planoprotostelium fungivorum TaxID=1890364 RepID=A0A2P6NYJ8_9EUKA|nr:hypothetical protein PROFUN_02311 [Planoprotostelium fungivorum]